MDLTGDLVDTITVDTPTGASGNYGTPTFGAQRTVAARAERTFKRMTSAAGVETTCSHRLFLEPGAFTSVQDALASRYWLPGTSTADAKQARRAVQAFEAKGLGETQVSHWEVYL